MKTLEKEVKETLSKRNISIIKDNRDRTLYYVIYPSTVPQYKGIDSAAYLVYTGEEEDLYREIIRDGIESVIQKYSMKL